MVGQPGRHGRCRLLGPLIAGCPWGHSGQCGGAQRREPGQALPEVVVHTLGDPAAMAPISRWDPAHHRVPIRRLGRPDTALRGSSTRSVPLSPPAEGEEQASPFAARAPWPALGVVSAPSRASAPASSSWRSSSARSVDPLSLCCTCRRALLTSTASMPSSWVLGGAKPASQRACLRSSPLPSASSMSRRMAQAGAPICAATRPTPLLLDGDGRWCHRGPAVRTSCHPSTTGALPS